jgi:hypothetical protein
MRKIFISTNCVGCNSAQGYNRQENIKKSASMILKHPTWMEMFHVEHCTKCLPIHAITWTGSVLAITDGTSLAQHFAEHVGDSER